jgi:hypothetical protein
MMALVALAAVSLLAPAEVSARPGFGGGGFAGVSFMAGLARRRLGLGRPGIRRRRYRPGPCGCRLGTGMGRTRLGMGRHLHTKPTGLDPLGMARRARQRLLAGGQ